MKEVENVTGRMGEGEAMVPAEEAASVASAPVESPVEAAAADESAVAGDIASAADASAPEAAAPAPQEAGVDPWGVLLQAGAQLVSALSAAAMPRQRRLLGSSATRRPARAAFGCHCHRRRQRDDWPMPSR